MKHDKKQQFSMNKVQTIWIWYDWAEIPATFVYFYIISNIWISVELWLKDFVVFISDLKI